MGNGGVYYEDFNIFYNLLIIKLIYVYVDLTYLPRHYYVI